MTKAYKGIFKMSLSRNKHEIYSKNEWIEVLVDEAITCLPNKAKIFMRKLNFKSNKVF